MPYFSEYILIMFHNKKIQSEILTKLSININLYDVNFTLIYKL